MAMNSNVLIESIKVRLKTELGYDLNQAEKGSPMNIMIEEIVSHIQAFAVVNTTVAPAIPVQVGGSGTGATTAPGTGTGTVS